MPSPYAKDFSFKPGSVYFACAAQGPFPKETSKAVEQGIRDKENPEVLDMNYVTSHTRATRQALADLIDADVGEVAFANSTTWGENIIAQSFPWKSGDEVLMMDGQFPATSLPWQVLSSYGVAARTFKCPDFIFDVATFIKALTPRTRLVSLEWVHFVSGDRIPLGEILDICRSRGVHTVLDVTQGCGAIPFSWKDYPVDAICCSGYKWLLSPYGTGFFAVKKSFADKFEHRYANWLTLESVVDGALEYTPTFVKTAQRFDVSSAMGFLNLVGMEESLRYLLRADVASLHKQTRTVLDAFLEALDKNAFSPLCTPRPQSNAQSARQSCILGLRSNVSTKPEDICTQLAQKGIWISTRSPGTLRIAPNFYNDAEQAVRVAEELNGFAR